MEGNRASVDKPGRGKTNAGGPTPYSPHNFQSVLADRIRFSTEPETPFSLVLLRVDEPVDLTGGLDAANWHERIGRTLSGRVRSGDLLLPLGSGRYALVVEGRPGDTAERLARDILRGTDSDGAGSDGQGDPPTFRIWAGSSVFPDDGDTVAKLVKRAKQTIRTLPTPIVAGDFETHKAAESLHILVVDDDQKVREEVSRVLLDLGHSVETADSSMAALLAMRRTPCNVVFADLRMPGTNGVDLIHKVREFSPGIQVVALAEGHAAIPIIEALRAGACDCVLKPIENPQTIAAAAHRIGEAVHRLGDERNLVEELQQENTVLRRELRLCREISMRDEATGLHNHSYFQECLGREAYRARRHNRAFTAVVAGVNPGGDVEDEPKVLRAVADTLRDASRRSDVLARTGEREFALLLPETLPVDGVRFVEKLCHRLEERVPSGSSGAAVRFGVASFPSDAEEEPQLMQRARIALARAQSTDGVRVVTASELDG